MLEIGPVSGWLPNKCFTIQPYAADEFPDLFKEPSCDVTTTTAVRTFWEKVVILHQEAHRLEDKPQPARFSRHYYDVMMMTGSEVKNEALADLGLLERVVDFAGRFYPREWARFDLAVPGSIVLTPPPHVEKALRRDYADMREMIYGEYPEFDEILGVLWILEEKINLLEGHYP